MSTPITDKPSKESSANYSFLMMPRHGLLIVFAVLSVFALMAGIWWLFVPSILLVALGIRDKMQTRHAILRNYPIAGHIRFLFETFRPEIRQYFLETDQEKVPFSRQQRALVYQRAKNVDSTDAFGTLSDFYREGHEWFIQSQYSRKVSDSHFRITVGNEHCSRPYSLSVFNISAMSFGSLSANAVEALNRGAAAGGFAHDTGEGSISPYHLKHGGDLIWEIGTGYFGCRTDDGRFNPETFAKRAALDSVKMIEIKISQGAKPGKGGMLPAAKITPEIAATRDIPQNVDCISPAGHSAFSTPLELVAFWQQLRELSGGKPVGFKLCIGQPWEFMAIVKAMLATGNYPDFIVVDGAEGGTGAAPPEFMDHLGMPLTDGLLLVHNTLVGAGIREKIKVGASGKIISGFDVARMLAIGADWCNSARGFMFAVGCIQSRSCHTNRCPTGVATQDPERQTALVVADKYLRVKNFHANTLKAVADIVGAVGLEHPDELKAYHLVRRQADGSIRLFSQQHHLLKKGALLDGSESGSFYGQIWDMADENSFSPKHLPA
ncbi:FMN-binding glutamate synthase family protein [Neisseria leonii]|uniref:FMN-binding glutamate synthase family protein n=1 Tax=Neisseria leonii TaxID=2995413 RepID=UPI00237A20D8|nr:FMN-binding glutamate synthase family protein [Neisseria sp. 3986]MDD9326611.1 FMN-binding glutamate synthase family protein [Neisseria sp. 3986]